MRAVKSEVKTEALQYLKKKYKKRFVILKSKKNIDTGLYTIHAAPKGNNEEKFSVYTYEKNSEYRDNYLKNLMGLEIQERDENKIKELFPNKYHSFYGNITFEDKIVEDKKNISINNLMAIDPKLEYKYVLFLNGQYSPEEDQQKLTEFILYLKNSQVYATDIDFVFFKNEPEKSAEEVPMYYVSNPDVDKMIKVQAKEFKQFKNKEDIKTFLQEEEKAS
jgi:glutamyl/glutaminyl-tRNA synthetase